MFGFTAKCPVGDIEREWVETSLQRFVELFGEDTLRAVRVVLPTKEFFPDEWHSPKDCAEKLLVRVCAYMGVARERIELETVCEEPDELRKLLPHYRESSSGAAGLYVRGEAEDKITIAGKLADSVNITALIATLAHELGHVLLLADSRIARDAPDMEPLTDLVAIFFGFGVFTANSAINFSQYSDGMKQGWSARRLGYLSEPVIAYALAYFAALRGEFRPAWAKKLTDNVAVYFRRSEDYLKRRPN